MIKICVATLSLGYEMHVESSIADMARGYTLIHRIQTRSGAQPTPYPMGNEGLLPKIKHLGHNADHSSPSSVEVKNGGAIPPRPKHIHGTVLIAFTFILPL
jgi:hypothetical protein